MVTYWKLVACPLCCIFLKDTEKNRIYSFKNPCSSVVSLTTFVKKSTLSEISARSFVVRYLLVLLVLEILLKMLVVS